MLKEILIVATLTSPNTAYGIDKKEEDLSKQFKNTLCTELTKVYSQSLVAMYNKVDYTDILFSYHTQLDNEDLDYAYLVFDTVRKASSVKYETTTEFPKFVDDYRKECLLKINVTIEKEKFII